MGENIEVKDVQKTEYLDKNGLDMLWAKVKENTRNQVEVESNRAVTQETRIIETKADKSELDNYVSDTALKALEQKVTANTAAISNKQNAGNYLHYETLNNEGYYEIPSVCIPGSDGISKTNIDAQSISVNGDDGSTASITSDTIRVGNESLGYTFITCGRVCRYYDNDGTFAFDLNSDGIKLEGGDDNHVLTSNGSTIDIRDYAKKTDVNSKQDAGNYISYDNTDTSAYNIDRSIKINDNEYHTKYGKDGLNIYYTDSILTADPSIINGHKGNKNFRIDNAGISCSNESGSLTISSNSIDSKTNTDYNFHIDRNSIRIGDETGDFAFEIDRHGIKLSDGSDSKILNSNGGFINIDNYALKSDIPEVDTSDFVSKTTTDEQIVKSELTSLGGLSIGSKIDNNYSEASLFLSNGTEPCLYMFDFEPNLSFSLTPSRLVLANNGRDNGDITITRDGISNPDNNANHVYATDGSIADLTQYIKKGDTDLTALQEKIAALEARIAALEAKHTETA